MCAPQVIDEYNHSMDYVDVRDHLSHVYNLDGGFWRDRKWWMPIFKELFKSSCDQGFVSYKRICELAEEKRATKEEAARKKAGEKAEKEARKKKKPAAGIKAAREEAEAAIPKGKKIEPMSHLRFLEMIAEGFVIEAYNSTKSTGHMSLAAYDLPRLERALSEMRGEEPPSEGARGAAATATPGPARAPTPMQAEAIPPATSGREGGKKRKRRMVSPSP